MSCVNINQSHKQIDQTVRSQTQIIHAVFIQYMLHLLLPRGFCFQAPIVGSVSTQRCVSWLSSLARSSYLCNMIRAAQTFLSLYVFEKVILPGYQTSSGQTLQLTNCCFSRSQHPQNLLNFSSLTKKRREQGLLWTIPTLHTDVNLVFSL